MIAPLWLIIAFWSALVVGYVFIGGLTYKLSLAFNMERCDRCNGSRSCYTDHEFGAIFLGALWPAGIPICGGIYLASRLGDIILDKKAGKEQ